MSTPITISALTKRFDATVAVDAVTLTVERGEMFFLLGPSGCGKTTLLRMLAGFTEPTEGTIRFGEREVTALPPEKRNAGMVFQSYALWPHMTVAENVEFGLKARRAPRDERRRRVEEALALVHMTGYAARRPGQLSGGQQQRVALARALAVRPDVLLLDEPLSNLDAKLRGEMREEIRQVCTKTGVTTVYVTHDQKEALSMADRLAVMSAGRTLQVGTPREVYERPVSAFVAEFMGPANFLRGRVVGEENGRTVIETSAGRLRAGAWAAGAAGGEVRAMIRPESFRVVSRDEARSGNVVAGVVRESVYFGEMAQHTVRLGETSARANDQAGEVRVYEPSPIGAVKPGATITLSIDPERIGLLPAQD